MSSTIPLRVRTPSTGSGEDHGSRLRRALLLTLTSLLVFSGRSAGQDVDLVDLSDIARFWEAYDRVVAEEDPSRRHVLFDSLYLQRGSPGLEAMITRRGLTTESYLEAIDAYPRFWSSVRPLTLRARTVSRGVGAALSRLEELYPALRPARIHFTVGALRTAGQVLGDVVYIGSELGLADSTVVTDELPGRLGESLRAYFDTNPIESVVFLNVHEYVHTQQSAFGTTLLAVAVQEGVAEYVAELVMGTPSPTPAIAFGAANDRRVASRFATELMSPNTNDWLYNDFGNEFGVRDLGYYVGYAIARLYHEESEDPEEALAELIELEYANPEELHRLVDASGYFGRSVEALSREYSASQPTVVSVTPANGTTGLEAGRTRLSIEFSEPMNTRFRGFDYGPLGEDGVLRIREVVGWSDDARTLTVQVELMPAQLQQMTLTSQFRTRAGAALEPYLIELDTRSPG